MAPERLQKLLARRGVASRRRAEELIVEGRVTVNGVVVRELGSKVDASRDRVELDGVALPPERRPIVVLLNKPAGYVATVRDAHAERTVVELVQGLGRRLYPVGRLDKETRGVLLLTDDGELAHALLHPSRGVEKVYQVAVWGQLSDEALRELERGVELEDGPTQPARIWAVERGPKGTRFRIALTEGRKRQVRLMVRAVGARVSDLVRVSFAGLTAAGLAEGAWRVLGAAEVEALRRAAGAGQARTPRPAKGRGQIREDERGERARREAAPRGAAPEHRRDRPKDPPAAQRPGGPRAGGGADQGAPRRRVLRARPRG